MTNDSISSKLQELFNLYESGALSKEEYDQLKMEYIKPITDKDSGENQHSEVDLKNEINQTKIVDSYDLDKEKDIISEKSTSEDKEELNEVQGETVLTNQEPKQHKTIIPDEKKISPSEKPKLSKGLIVTISLLSITIIVALVYIFFISSNRLEKNQPQVENTSSNNRSIEKNETIRDNSTPVNTVKSWIIALGEKDFSYAYSLVKGKQWQGELEWFSSVKAYGGIYKTDILECRLIENNDSENIVFVKYNAYDSTNGDGTYSQMLTLKNSSEGWFIYRLKNANN